METCQYAPGDLVFLFNPQAKTGEAAKFHRKWKGPYEVLKRTNEVDYRIRKPSDPRSRSKVVHFNNLKLYQRIQGESTRRQEKDSEGCGTVAMDSPIDAEESDDLPADLFSFPRNSMVVSSPGHQHGGNNWRDHPWRDHPSSANWRDHPSGYHLASTNWTWYRARRLGRYTLVLVKDVGEVQEKAVGRSVASECDESSGSDTSHHRLMTVHAQREWHVFQDRYGEWEFNAVMSSDLPPVLGMKFGGFRRIIHAQKDRVLRLKEDCMRKITHLKSKGERWKERKKHSVEHWCWTQTELTTGVWHFVFLLSFLFVFSLWQKSNTRRLPLSCGGGVV